MTEELKEQIHERVYNIKVPTLGFSRRDLFNIAMEYAEPREKRIAELEAEVKEWKDKADLWCKTANLKDHNIMINKELEKENAELKEKYVKNITDCDICDTYCNSQLTKAKELLKWFVWYFREGSPNLVPYKHKVEEAEQFIKDSEVEK